MKRFNKRIALLLALTLMMPAWSFGANPETIEQITDAHHEVELTVYQSSVS